MMYLVHSDGKHARLQSPAEASLQKRIPASLHYTQGIRPAQNASHFNSIKPLIAKHINLLVSHLVYPNSG